MCPSSRIAHFGVCPYRFCYSKISATPQRQSFRERSKDISTNSEVILNCISIFNSFIFYSFYIFFCFTILLLLFVFRCPLTALQRPPPIVLHPPSALHRPPSALHRPPSAVHRPPLQSPRAVPRFLACCIVWSRTVIWINNRSIHATNVQQRWIKLEKRSDRTPLLPVVEPDESPYHKHCAHELCCYRMN